MNQNKSKNIITALLCFMLPALIMLIAFAKMGMAPFGKSSTMIMDMAGQYVEFLCGLKNGDIFFSWSKSLGGSYIGVFTYYVSSPLSFLTIFCPNSKMPIAVLFLTVLKIGLAGLTFSFMLRYRFKRYDLSTVIFSLLYALMSYNIAYSMCIMWLDGVIWLPVIIIGIEKIFREKKSGILTVALFVSFISTYYISYMTGLFTALYFVYRCFEEKFGIKKIFQSFRKFALSVVVAASWGAFILIPTLISLFQGKIGTVNNDYSSKFNFQLKNFLYKFLPGKYDSITNSGSPFIYCGIISLLLFLCFFVVRKVPLRSKILTGIFTILLALSLWLSPMDKVWHVFQYPNWFPYRYCFVFSFLIILTAYRAYMEMKLTKPVIALILLAVCCVDMYGNTYGILRGLDREFGYHSYESYNGYKEMIEPLVAEAKKDENGFFRVGATFERTKNEPIGFGYNGITHYSSTFNRHVNNFLQKMGMAQAWLWSSYFGSTVVTDSIFSVRYVLSESPVSPYYTRIKDSGSAQLYYNGNAISIATAVNGQSLSSFQFGDSSFSTQNQLIKSLTNIQEDCFINMDRVESNKDGSVEYSFISNGKPLYGHFSTSNGGGSLSVNGQRISELFTTETNCIHYLGTFNEGESVTVTVDNIGSISGRICYLNTEVYERAVSALKSRELKVEKYHNGSVQGTVTAIEGDVLFTTIPYDKGWKAYVDGKEVKLNTFAESLIVVPLTPGEHKIKMTYVPLGLKEGICVSVIPTLLVLILLLATKKLTLVKTKKS